MTSWAKVGAKCVCVRQGKFADAAAFGCEYPVAGKTYTVRAVINGALNKYGTPKTGIALVEVVNPPMAWPSGDYGEAIWAAESFRPVLTKTQEQDVALFKRIASEAPVFAEPQ